MVGAIPTILLCFAFIFALFATTGLVPDFGRWKWGWAAVWFLITALLLGGPLQHLLIR